MEYPLLQLLMILVVMSLDLGYAIWDTYSNVDTAVSIPSFNVTFFLIQIDSPCHSLPPPQKKKYFQFKIQFSPQDNRA